MFGVVADGGFESQEQPADEFGGGGADQLGGGADQFGGGGDFGAQQVSTVTSTVSCTGKMIER